MLMKAITVPFAIRKRFDQALDKFEKNGVIEKVQHEEWASSMVSVIKPVGQVRICGDYSGTINKNSQLERYPVPTLAELLNKLSVGKKYTKLDLSQVYHQLELAPESRQYTTVNPHWGLY